MKYKNYILVCDEDDKVWESSSIIWASIGGEDEASQSVSTHLDIDIGLTILLGDNETFTKFGPVRMILGDTETDYFRIIRFRSDDWKTYRLLCRK